MAAFLAFRLWQKSASRSWDMLVLVLLIAVVGAGSFIFHTIATRWAGLADVLPIAIFIHFGLGVFLYRVANIDLMWAMLGVFAFAIYSVALQKILPPELLNRSVQYFPAATLLLAMAVYEKIKKSPAAKFFILALITFIISLALRSLDNAICPYFPLGIHYMWHLLNAVVMYSVYKGIIAYSKIDVEV